MDREQRAQDQYNAAVARFLEQQTDDAATVLWCEAYIAANFITDVTDPRHMTPEQAAGAALAAYRRAQ